MYPTLENIREIAAKGQHKRVPVCREVYADRGVGTLFFSRI